MRKEQQYEYKSKQFHTTGVCAGILLMLASLFVTSSQTGIFPLSPLPIPYIPGEIIPKAAMVAPQILINGSDPSAGWDDCPWVNGTGTYGDPYVIHDLAINGGGARMCIYITNTREYFRVENCTLMNAGDYRNIGISLSNSTNGVIRNNTCNQIPRYGIYLGSGSDNNTLEGNTCSNGDNSGIYVYASNNLIIRNNTCTGNTNWGIIIHGSDCTLVNNTCSGNSQCGIFIGGYGSNRITKNTCSGNSIAGIKIYRSSHNLVDENTCMGNGGAGISVENWYSDDPDAFDSSKDNMCKWNTCIGNFIGFEIEYVNNNYFSENICTSNINCGFSLREASYNSIAGNNCTGTSKYGFYLYLSNSNFIFDNSVRDYTQSQIELADSFDNHVYANYFWYVPVASFDLEGTVYQAGIPVGFVDTTIGDAPFSFKWNFGDGTRNSTLQNPTHTFESPGKYTITLMVTDFDGDVSIIQKTIIVEFSYWITVGIPIASLCCIAVIAVIILHHWRKKHVRKGQPSSSLT